MVDAVAVAAGFLARPSVLSARFRGLSAVFPARVARGFGVRGPSCWACLSCFRAHPAPDAPCIDADIFACILANLREQPVWRPSPG